MLFIAGVLTILLPCILPLIPIVLGVSIAGKSKLRPLLTIAGMLVSFIGFTFLLILVLKNFIGVEVHMRTATYLILLLFGLGFVTHNKHIWNAGAVIGGFFFLDAGLNFVLVAIALGFIAMHVGGKIADYKTSGLEFNARQPGS